jgi:hypothetical protein
MIVLGGGFPSKATGFADLVTAPKKRPRYAFAVRSLDGKFRQAIGYVQWLSGKSMTLGLPAAPSEDPTYMSCKSTNSSDDVVYGFELFEAYKGIWRGWSWGTGEFPQLVCTKTTSFDTVDGYEAVDFPQPDFEPNTVLLTIIHDLEVGYIIRAHVNDTLWTKESLHVKIRKCHSYDAGENKVYGGYDDIYLIRKIEYDQKLYLYGYVPLMTPYTGHPVQQTTRTPWFASGIVVTVQSACLNLTNTEYNQAGMEVSTLLHDYRVESLFQDYETARANPIVTYDP